MIIDLSSLRAFVRLQKRVLKEDQKGGFRETWQDLGFIWAAIKPGVSPFKDKSDIRGKRLGSQGVEGLLYEVIVRNEVSLKPNMRLLWNDKTLVIVSLSSKELPGLYQKFIATELPPKENARSYHA